MIRSITITNHLDESITMELRFPEKSGFLLRDIPSGLGPSKANISTSELAAYDGSMYNSARVEQRNIVFNLEFSENPSIELNRLKSYQYFPIKKRVKISVETDNRVCETYGYVESNEPNIFSAREGTTISIICPDPWFYTTNKDITLFSGAESLFEFPFSNESLDTKLIIFGNIQIIAEQSIIYTGDASIGMIIYIHAIGPAPNLVIVDLRTQETMSINSAKLAALTGSDIMDGDDIIISTIKGDKYIILIRNGVIINIFNALNKNSSWFQLEKGDNRIAYTSDNNTNLNLQFRIESQIAYEGV